jgi:hypothetical protein
MYHTCDPLATHIIKQPFPAPPLSRCCCYCCDRTGQVNLTCADSTWAADFNVTLTASAGTTSCEDNKAATEVQVKYNTKPALSLTGDANKTVCANSGQVTLSFTPTATANGANLPWKMTFDTGSSGVTCPETSDTGGTGEPHWISLLVPDGVQGLGYVMRSDCDCSAVLCQRSTDTTMILHGHVKRCTMASNRCWAGHTQ